MSHLTQELHRLGQPTSNSTVREWIAGRSAPRPERALAISELSGGHVRVADVYRHREELRR